MSRYPISVVTVLLACQTLMRAQAVGPVLEQRVEPVYSAGLTKWLVDPARIQMVIDSEGNPYSLDSTTSLPDNVVEALAKWKFKPGIGNGARSAFGIVLRLQVNRPFDEYLTMAARPSSLIHTHPGSAVSASKMTMESARKLEAKLPDTAINEKSMDQRVELISYAASSDDPDALEMRLRQISWLVRKEPGESVLGSPEALILQGQGPSQGSSYYDQMKLLWMEQHAREPENAFILGHATWFLQFSDPEAAEGMLTPAVSNVGGAAAWLGELYGYAALGVTGFAPGKGREVMAGLKIPESPFAIHASVALGESKDGRILLSALSAVTSAGKSLNDAGKLPAGYDGLCRMLLARVKSFYPETTFSCDPGNGLAPGSNPASKVVPAQIIRRSVPSYPDEARNRHLKGSVHLAAVIAKDGRIKDLELLSGPLPFYKASRTAVLQWLYHPTMQNGEPVEVKCQIDVNYELD